MTDLLVQGGRPLSGRVTVPPDKSISHRALMLASLGEGVCRVHPLSQGADNQSTLSLLRGLGVPVEVEADAALVTGVGHPKNFQPGTFDCGNSGTTMRLMTGILSGAAGPFTLTGDPSLSKRPMSRLLPLELMGAQVNGVSRGERIYPPITVRGGGLVGCAHTLTIASAQVKSALLLAGLFAEGRTTVTEPGRSRDHTERMLQQLGAPVEEASDGTISVTTRDKPWRCASIEVAPDVSSAAFLLAAAALTQSRDLVVRTGVNPTRTGFLDVLTRMGVTLEVDERSGGPEPVADVRVAGGRLQGAEVAGALALRAIDELPLIAGLAAFAEGETVIRDAAELRVKETDRITATHQLLTTFGVRSTETPDGLIIEGGRPQPARVPASEDHRMMMTAAVMALAIEGATTVEGAEVGDVSYPGFAAQLRTLGAEVEELRG